MIWRYPVAGRRKGIGLARVLADIGVVHVGELYLVKWTEKRISCLMEAYIYRLSSWSKVKGGSVRTPLRLCRSVLLLLAKKEG